ncbi:MAG: hypothetical protein COX40_03560 [Candidatus Omnitrophica bacterium CG23_combo_of_CG06-09_8_20_14_all_40_11]|nr:MAG: hypothetical protein COX40_03560 [Candidatus Omnitrophica bacterium CG23_combo_of_CG06-09_8_20_14_all_40_11]
MAIFLFIMCSISFLSGIFASTGATTIFQQIVGAISFVTSAILLIGAAIVNAVDKLTIETRKSKTNA